MSDTKVRARKATVLLREDHETIKKLFKQYEKLGDDATDKKQGLFEEIKQGLTVHAQIEEEIFYPAVESSDDEEAAEIVQEAHEEHKIVKTLLEELSELSAGDDAFEAKMKVLQENVEHHAEEEQEDIFPLFDDLDKDEQDVVSETLEMRRRELGQAE
jgi:hemerythrin superfamily protein